MSHTSFDIENKWKWFVNGRRDVVDMNFHLRYYEWVETCWLVSHSTKCLKYFHHKKKGKRKRIYVNFNGFRNYFRIHMMMMMMMSVRCETREKWILNRKQFSILSYFTSWLCQRNFQFSLTLVNFSFDCIFIMPRVIERRDERILMENLRLLFWKLMTLCMSYNVDGLQRKFELVIQQHTIQKSTDKNFNFIFC